MHNHMQIGSKIRSTLGILQVLGTVARDYKVVIGNNVSKFGILDMVMSNQQVFSAVAGD